MLKAINRDQAQFVALLARDARMRRDASLGKVRESELAEFRAARGAHNPTASLGFAPLSSEDPQIGALREAIASLSSDGRAELYALMRIGQGDLAARRWHRGITEAANLGDETVTAALIEDADLHEHLMKGLYEAKLAS